MSIINRKDKIKIVITLDTDEYKSLITLLENAISDFEFVERVCDKTNFTSSKIGLRVVLNQLNGNNP